MQQSGHHSGGSGCQPAYNGPSRAVPTQCGARPGTTMAASTVERYPRHQPFPASGSLSGGVNMDLRRLTQSLGVMTGTVYCYVVTTVKYADGQFVQTGSAPNYQGGLITLCTCKHQMRAGKPADQWPGFWIAGVTGTPQSPDRRNYLFYLMRVERGFESQQDLWHWLAEKAPQAARAKRADKNWLGDVYVPKPAPGNPYDPSTYISPCPQHVHRPTAWYRDIAYSNRGRRPALLVGNPAYSFLWTAPRVPVPFAMKRGSKNQRLDELLPALRQASRL
jgi:hypothetical protein